MGTITIEPKDAVEFQLLTSMLKKMKIKMKLNLTERERKKLLAIPNMKVLIESIEKIVNRVSFFHFGKNKRHL